MLGGKLLLFVIPCSPSHLGAFSKTCGHALTGNRHAKSRGFLHAQTLGGAPEWNPANCSELLGVSKEAGPALSTIVPPKEQGRGTSDFGGRTSAALLAGTEYWARNKFDILARGPLAPLLLPLAGSPCLKSSARLSAPHLSFPNIPSPAPIAQSCLAAVGPAAPGAHLQRLQPARLVAFWTLLELLRANWRIC
jgi:hypothetical protein